MNGGLSKDSPRRTVVALALALYALTGVVFLAGKGISVRTEDRLFATANFPVEDLVFDPTQIPAQKGKKAGAVNLDDLVEASPDILSRGASLYAENCSFCHGEQGLGDGAAGAGLEPPPRNLTLPDGWKNGTRLSDIFQSLTEGVPGTAMAAYDTLSIEDRFAMAHHVQSLGTFAHGTDTPESLEALDEKYGLSSGTQEPNRISVSRAIERMVGESGSAAPLELPPEWLDEPRGQLFQKIVVDPKRAAETLSASDDWRKHPGNFVSTVTGGAPANGFSPSAATLSAAQWRLLRETIVNIVEGANS